MNSELEKKLKSEIIRLINLPNYHQNELKNIMSDFDKVLEKVSTLPKEKQDEVGRMFLALLVKHKLINV